MHIGEKIRIARLAKGLTQEALGELLGVQKSAIAKYESGRVVNIKRSTLKKISDVLGIRPAELIIEEKPIETAELHAEIIMDEEYVNMYENFKLLDDAQRKIVVDLVNSLAATKKGSLVAPK